MERDGISPVAQLIACAFRYQAWSSQGLDQRALDRIALLDADLLDQELDEHQTLAVVRFLDATDDLAAAALA